MVRRARWKESQRISRMIADAASREHAGEERSARAAVGLQKGGVWSRIKGFLSGVLGFIAGLAGVILITVCYAVFDTAKELTPATGDRPQHLRVRLVRPAAFGRITACQYPPLLLRLAGANPPCLSRTT